MTDWLQESERVEVGLQISPLPESVEYPFAIAVWRFH
jgi:hypothetical protein